MIMNCDTRQIENGIVRPTITASMYQYAGTAYDAQRLAESVPSKPGVAFYAFSFGGKTVGFVGPDDREFELGLYSRVKHRCLARKIWW